MRYEFDVQMDEKTLYDFLMAHNNMGSSGMLWIFLGVLALALAVFSGNSTPLTYRLLYALFGVLFIVYIPWDLKKKAKKQLKTNPYYAKPIHYVVDEEGVHSAQDDQEGIVAWKRFGRVKVTKKNVILYMRNRNACIFPKEVFGKDLDKAVEWMRSMAGKETETETGNEE